MPYRTLASYKTLRLQKAPLATCLRGGRRVSHRHETTGSSGRIHVVRDRPEGAEAATKDGEAAKKDDKTKEGADKKPDEKKSAEKKPTQEKK